MRALFLTTVLPGNGRGGGEVVSQLFVDAIRAAGWDVDVVGYQRTGDPPAAGARVWSAGERPIETGADRRATLAWIIAAYVRREPYTAAKFRSFAYTRTARRLLGPPAPDLVVVDHLQMSWIRPLVTSDIPVVVIAHNAEASLYAKLAGTASRRLVRTAYGREARLVAAVERRLRTDVRRTWTLSAEDATEIGGRAFSVPGGRAPDPAGDQPMPRRDIALLGSWTWSANRAGLDWFAAAVLPHLPLELTVGLAGKGADHLRGRRPGLEILGGVDDAFAHLLSGRVVAVPSRAGGGVQIKTLDAIASGRPLVATSVALRGLTALPATVHVHDDPAAFAARLAALARAAPDFAAESAARRWTYDRRLAFLADVAAALEEATG